jgi:hypothetical protein
MTDPKDLDASMEDEYDEEADSDFAGNAEGEPSSPSSDDGESNIAKADLPPRKRRKTTATSRKREETPELDSGDEATIGEREKIKRKNKRKGDVDDNGESDDEDNSWRARTRAMREREKDERKQNKLANTQGSTIDVDKLWEEMNRPGGPDLPPPLLVEDPQDERSMDSQPTAAGSNETRSGHEANQTGDIIAAKENIRSGQESEDTITIRRTYKYAGVVHAEEKTVPKSSAEARLWLSQQSSKLQTSQNGEDRSIRRPLRKISRFDPNLNSLESIGRSWEIRGVSGHAVDGPKLNTVEKSKMDWALHVDKEGLKEELDEHAKAKESYQGRMDFLGQVEQRRDDEGRAARLKA